MEILTYKVHHQGGEYEAVCVQHPYIAWIADTEAEEVEGVQELAFQYYLDENN